MQIYISARLPYNYAQYADQVHCPLEHCRSQPLQRSDLPGRYTVPLLISTIAVIHRAGLSRFCRYSLQVIRSRSRPSRLSMSAFLPHALIFCITQVIGWYITPFSGITQDFLIMIIMLPPLFGAHLGTAILTSTSLWCAYGHLIFSYGAMACIKSDLTASSPIPGTYLLCSIQTLVYNK